MFQNDGVSLLDWGQVGNVMQSFLMVQQLKWQHIHKLENNLFKSDYSQSKSECICLIGQSVQLPHSQKWL